MNKQHFVTVVIPVFNESESLRRCLHALNNQSFPGEKTEIIVVDNASVEDIETVTLSFQRVRYAYEPERGSYAARNKGVLLSRGDLVAFTDSDCIPEPRWISELVSQYDYHESCGLVAGCVKTTIREESKVSSAELYDKIFAFPQARYVKEYKFGVTANVLTSVEVFNQVGLFNSKLKSGGDYEWGWRAYQTGYSIVYAPTAIVFHPARTTFSEISTKSLRVVQGHYELKKLNVYSPTKFFLATFADLFVPFRSSLSILTYSNCIDISDKVKVVLISIRLSYLRGILRLRLQILDILKNLFFIHKENK